MSVPETYALVRNNFRVRILTVLSFDRALSGSRDVCPFEAVLVVLPKLGVDTAVQADLVQGHAGAEKERG